MSPNNQIQNGYAQYGHAQQGHAQTSNNRTPGAAAWTQPLVQAQNNHFTVSKPPPQPSSASPNAISSEKKTKILEDKPPSMTYLMKKSKCDSKKDPKDWQKEYEERKKQLAMGGAGSSSPGKKQEQKPVAISRSNLTSGQNLLTSGSCPAPSSDSKSEKIEDLILESSSSISPPKVQKLVLVRRNSVDNKAHEEAEQDKLASILAFQPKNDEKPTQEPLIKKYLVSEEYQEPLDEKPTESLIKKSLVSEEYQELLVDKSIVPLTSENEAHSALYYQNYQAPPIVQKPTASPKSALTTSGSGPSTAAPSSGDSKRKVEEKAPDIQKLMKKAKCDSSRDAKDWQKEYEERKRLAMAAFKS